MESRKRTGEVDFEVGFFTGREAAGGAAGEGEVGVGSEKGSGLRQFFEEESFFGAVGAAEGEEGVGGVQLFPKQRSGFLVKAADGWSAEKRGAGKVYFLPKTAEGKVGVQSGGGELRNYSDSSVYEKTQKKPPFCGDWRMRRNYLG